MAQGLEFRISGFGFRAWGLGFDQPDDCAGRDKEVNE